MDRQTAMRAKVERMTRSPVEGLVLRMAGPTMAAMLITALYNIADTYFVGHLGTTATAAVGIAYPLMAIIMAIGFFFGHGAGNCISRQFGAREFDAAAGMSATGFFSVLLAGTAVAAAGLLFLTPLARLLGATDTVLPLAREYLFYILLAAPFMAGSFTLNNLLRFQGNAFYGMVALAAGAVLNILLDPLFIFVLGLGVKGAALATLVSQGVGFCLLYAANTRRSGVRIRFRNFTPGRAEYREIARGGLPSLCRQALACVGVVCLNQMAGEFGDAAIAAMSVVQRVAMFVGALLVGFGHGYQPVCGFNYGARRYDRMKRAFWFCVRLSTLALTGAAAAGFVYAPGIIAFFRPDDPAVIAIGAQALRFQCLTCPAMGWVLITNMTLQNLGHAGRATLMAGAKPGLFMLPFLLIATPRLGLLAVQLAQPFAEAMVLLLSVPVGAAMLRSIPDGDASLADSQTAVLRRTSGQSGRFGMDDAW